MNQLLEGLSTTEAGNTREDGRGSGWSRCWRRDDRPEKGGAPGAPKPRPKPKPR